MTVFIHKGDEPLSVRQATNRGLKHVERELSEAGARPGDQEILRNVAQVDLPDRLKAVVAALGATSYADYALAWEADNTTNGLNNLFNHQIVAFKAALARLAQRDLSVDYPETQVGTGVFEPDPITGEPVEVMQTIPAMPALVAENIEYPVFDEATGEQTGTAPEPDREVTAQLERDAAEREAMQQVIDRTPQEVKDFAG